MRDTEEDEGNQGFVDLKRDWAEKGIKVYGKENEGNKDTPTDTPEPNDREGYRNSVGETRVEDTENSEEELERRSV